MANSKSSKKRIVQNQKRRLRNKIIKSKNRTLTKKFNSLVDSYISGGSNDDSKKEAITHLFKEVSAHTNSVWSKGVYKRNKASKITSQLQRKYNQL